MMLRNEARLYQRRESDAITTRYVKDHLRCKGQKFLRFSKTSEKWQKKETARQNTFAFHSGESKSKSAFDT